MRLSGHALVAALFGSAAVLGVVPRTASAGPITSSAKHVTLVFGRPTRLSVSLYQWSRTTNPNRYILLGKGTTKNPATIARIVQVVNLVDAPSGHTCPALPGSRSVLQFGYRNGDVWTVVEGGCWDFHTHGIVATAVGDPAVFGTLPRLLNRVAGVKGSG